MSDLFPKNTIAKLNALIERYGAAGVFIAAVSPIPYKALAWIAGAGKNGFPSFHSSWVIWQRYQVWFSRSFVRNLR